MTLVNEYPPDYCPCKGASSPGCDPKTFCWSHCQHEPEPENAYRVCFECNHVYATAADLEAAYLREVTTMHGAEQAGRPASEIHFCQECLHDW